MTLKECDQFKEMGIIEHISVIGNAGRWLVHVDLSKNVHTWFTNVRGGDKIFTNFETALSWAYFYCDFVSVELVGKHICQAVKK